MNGEIRELREFLEGKFGEIDGRFATLETAVQENRAGIRENGVLIERNQDLIRTLAEQVRAVDRKLDQKVDTLRSEMKAGFREMNGLLLGPQGLDRRVTDLEHRVDTLEEGR